jgi:hypothetical protein
LAIEQISKANVLEVALAQWREELERIRESLPPGTRLEVNLDQLGVHQRLDGRCSRPS